MLWENTKRSKLVLALKEKKIYTSSSVMLRALRMAEQWGGNFFLLRGIRKLEEVASGNKIFKCIMQGRLF